MDKLIEKTILFVQQTLATAEAGHDWFHIERVYKTAITINEQEQANTLVVSLAALLHDIADSKFHHGDEDLGPQLAAEFLSKNLVPNTVIESVVAIIQNMSFKNSFEQSNYRSIELDVVQDADRLDAIGAIGIARAFTYGGYKNRILYDPTIVPNLTMTKEEYKNSTGTTINHFYEKLLLLKDLMRTKTGIRLAQQRHNFMLSYLAQFYGEWNGKY